MDENQKFKAKKLVEQECSCNNYCNLESNHFSAKSAKFYLGVQSHITRRAPYSPSFFPIHILESIHVESLNASNHTKLIPKSDGKCDHYIKVYKSIISAFRSIQTDQLTPNQYTLMKKCLCARHSARGEEHKGKTQSLLLSHKNLIEGKRK